MVGEFLYKKRTLFPRILGSTEIYEWEDLMIALFGIDLAMLGMILGVVLIRGSIFL